MTDQTRTDQTRTHTTRTEQAMPALRILVAIALLFAAGVMWQHLPNKLQSWAPIQVDGAVGERIEGHGIAVTVHEVTLAHEVTVTNEGIPHRLSTSGAWLAIALTYEPLLLDNHPKMILQADGRTFSNALTGLNSRAAPGFPVRGVVAFQLPAAPDEATLLVSNSEQDQWGNPLTAPLSTQIAVRIPLAGKAVVDTVDLDKMSAG